MVDLGLYVDPTLDRCLSGVGAIVGWEVVLTQIIEGWVVHPWVPESVEVLMVDVSVDQCRHISDPGLSTGPTVQTELVGHRDEPLELACRGMSRDLLNNA
jgi:hypothetical protein